MKNAYIIHGSFGHPEENWIPWLKTELESKGYEVKVPAFPCGEEQNFDNWMEVIRPYLSEMSEETVLVGHSIGPAFILAVLEQLETPVRKAVLVSGFLGLLGNETFDEVNKTISAREFDWEKVRGNAGEFVMLHGSDDPYVPPAKSVELGGHLGVTPIMIENGGHLNEAAGFTEFPQLLKEVLQ